MIFALCVGEFEFVFPFVIARSNESCDVAIKAEVYFAALDSRAVVRNDKR